MMKKREDRENEKGSKQEQEGGMYGNATKS
jgi:hypothetical protein